MVMPELIGVMRVHDANHARTDRGKFTSNSFEQQAIRFSVPKHQTRSSKFECVDQSGTPKYKLGGAGWVGSGLSRNHVFRFGWGLRCLLIR